MTDLYLIRHGKTAGNMEGRYVGSTDEPLCEAGIAEVRACRCRMEALYSQVNKCDCVSKTDDGYIVTKLPEKVYVSPMLRCIQTAEILFPGADRIAVSDFREMDFGQFEYKNYEELSGDARYQAFIDSGGHLDFPGAEPQQQFRQRVRNAFEQCLETTVQNRSGQNNEGMEQVRLEENEAFMADPVSDEPRKSLIFVVHGGTIMAILDAFARPHRDYFDWQIGTACGYHCEIRMEKNHFYLENITEIEG